MPDSPSFLREYGRAVLWHWDAKAGYAAGLFAGALFTASPIARSRLNDLAASGITVSALGLTFALTSMSLLSAIIDRRMVEVLDGLEQKGGGRAYGLHGLLMAFKSVAAIGAVGVLVWLIVRGVAEPRLDGNSWEAVRVVVGAIACFFTVWLLGALVGLVHTVAVLIGGKAQLIRQQEIGARPTVRPTDRSA